jgi:hypothetical protein
LYSRVGGNVPSIEEVYLELLHGTGHHNRVAVHPVEIG